MILNHPDFIVFIDLEPTSTVTIKTPDPQVDETEETEPTPVWTGQINMTDVAKFQGMALPVTGECKSIAADVGDKLNVIGRIGYSNVRNLFLVLLLLTKIILGMGLFGENETISLEGNSAITNFTERFSSRQNSIFQFAQLP